EKVLFASAKVGTGTGEILEAVVREVPPPRGDADAPLRALIFDSHYDPYRGVIVYVRVVDGEIGPGTGVRTRATNRVHAVGALGCGFRGGSLGLPHTATAQERLEREFGLHLITPAATVEYDVYDGEGARTVVDTPALLPAPTAMERIEEPYVKLSIVVPAQY